MKHIYTLVCLFLLSGVANADSVMSTLLLSHTLDKKSPAGAGTFWLIRYLSTFRKSSPSRQINTGSHRNRLMDRWSVRG